MKTSGGTHQKSALESRLGAWDDAVAAQAVTRTGRRSLNWLLYTTAVGSALAMATDAGAQIIHYGGAPVTLPAGSGGTNTAPIFSAGGNRFNLVGADFTSFGVVDLRAFGKAGVLVNLSSGVQKLSSNAVISSKAGRFAGSFHPLKLVNGYFKYSLGSFVAGQPRFAGIDFNTGGRGTSYSTQQPKIHYGWIELEFGGIPDPTSITAIDFAYNSVVGQGITAGETSEPANTATPEPGTAALSLLAMGAAGVLAWRRKKAALNTV